MLERLKPCPFCGKSAVAFYQDDNPVLQKLGVKGRVWVVGCSTSDCILYANKEKKIAKLFFWDGDISKLITKWNRRMAVADAQIAELNELGDRCIRKMTKALLYGIDEGAQDGAD